MRFFSTQKTIVNDFQRRLVGVLAMQLSTVFGKINIFLIIKNYILVPLIQITFKWKTPVKKRKFLSNSSLSAA